MALPIVETQITQHTLWQALTGRLPPLELPATPIGRGVLDSRVVAAGDLFVALAGEQTDGHLYLAQAMAAGAGAVICEERGRESVRRAGAILIDCTAGRWQREAALPRPATAGVPIAYLVDDSVRGLQAVGGFQRAHRTRAGLRVIGITGSIGKTSTKELTAAVMRQRFSTLASPGNLNSEQGLPLALLSLSTDHECAVLEMGMYALGEIHRLCELARPQVGVVTMVGPVHLERLGSIEAIAQAKSELPQALPSAEDGGAVVLNWDDDRVQTMADLTRARVFRVGLTPAADLWADEIVGLGMEGIRFRFHHRRADGQVESLHARVPLLGRHSVHTALCAAGVGLVEGLGWDEIIAGLQSLPGQLRLVVMPGINGSTVVDDTYNASPTSMIAALNLLADLTPPGGGRRVAVLGDMRELGDYSREGHKLVGRRTAGVAGLLITVGDLGRSIGDEAQDAGLPAAAIRRTETADEAVACLRELLRADDLVLVKGSRAIGMEEIVSAITLATAAQGK